MPLSGFPKDQTNPDPINVDQETLDFRRSSFSLLLSLLIPTFSFEIAPATIASHLRSRFQCSPTTQASLSLELRFIVWCPIIFRAGSLDQWAVTHSLNEWLLPSQHPGCYRNPTSFDQLNYVLGTLVANLGYFPLGHGPYRPQPHSRRYLAPFGVCQGLVGGEAP